MASPPGWGIVDEVNMSRPVERHQHIVSKIVIASGYHRESAAGVPQPQAGAGGGLVAPFILPDPLDDRGEDPLVALAAPARPYLLHQPIDTRTGIR